MVNSVLFKRLGILIDTLNKRNIEVLFWYIPRIYNKQADKLANIVL